VLLALDRGDRPTEIARRFDVSRIWVYQVRHWVEATGERSSLRIGGYRRSRLADSELVLRSWIAAESDLTLTMSAGAQIGHRTPRERRTAVE
jgi:transposase